MTLLLFLRQPARTWHRPGPLTWLAGNTLLGHLLDKMQDGAGGGVAAVVPGDEAALKAWLAEHYPDTAVEVIVAEEGAALADVLGRCHSITADGPLFIAHDQALVRAAYDKMTEMAAGSEGMVLVPKDDRTTVVAVDEAGRVTVVPAGAEAGVLWLCRAATLLDADLSGLAGAEATPAALARRLLAAGTALARAQVGFYLRVEDAESILSANRRLLGTDYASPDAVDRSYAEEFTVLPPVYLHPDAIVERSVVGPYVAVASGAVVENCVIRNSVVDRATRLDGVFADGGLFGAGTALKGQAISPIVDGEGHQASN